MSAKDSTVLNEIERLYRVFETNSSETDNAISLLELEKKLGSTFIRVSRRLTLKRRRSPSVESKDFVNNIYWDPLLNPMADLSEEMLFEYVGNAKLPITTNLQRLKLLEQVVIKDLEECKKEEELQGKPSEIEPRKTIEAPAVACSANHTHITILNQTVNFGNTNFDANSVTLSVPSRIHFQHTNVNVVNQPIINIQSIKNNVEQANNIVSDRASERILPRYVPAGPVNAIPFITPGFRPKLPEIVPKISKTDTNLTFQNPPGIAPGGNSLVFGNTVGESRASKVNGRGNTEFNAADQWRSRVPESSFTLTDMRQSAMNDSESQKADAKQKNGVCSRVFQIFNLARAASLCIYSIYIAYKGYTNPFYVQIGAQGLMVATIFFASLDFVVAATRAFPKTLWVFWDVENTPAYNSVFSLVADHELILDIFPVLLNLVCKVYSTRLAEVLVDPAFTADLNSLTFKELEQPAYHNFVLLMLYVATLIYQILFHSFKIASRMCRIKAFTLGSLVLCKAVLLAFDITVNSFILYETLTTLGMNFLQMGRIQNLMLSIVIPGPVVSLFTNVLLNYPLNYSFKLLEKSQKSLWSKCKSAASRTFHPAISSIFGTYAVYVIVATGLVLYNIKQFDPFSFYKSTGTVPDVLNYKDILLGLAVTNILINYAIGALCSVLYWALVILSGFWKGINFKI